MFVLFDKISINLDSFNLDDSEIKTQYADLEIIPHFLIFSLSSRGCGCMDSHGHGMHRGASWAVFVCFFVFLGSIVCRFDVHKKSLK